MATNRPNQPLEGTLADLSEQIGALVRQEVNAAKEELLQKAGAVGVDAVLLMGAGLLAYVAFLAFVAGVILLVAKLLPDWLAAMFVSAALAGLAYPMAKLALERLQQGDFLPKGTINAVKTQVDEATQ